MHISAIVPAYNAAEYLTRAIESLIQTRYPNLEVIIVDDGSEDGTLDIAYRLKDKYQNILAVFHHSHKEHRGVSATRNLGIKKSTGELVCFLDADDYIFPHRFESAVPCLENKPTIDGVYQLTCMKYEAMVSKVNWWDNCPYFGLTVSVEPKRLLQTLLTGACWHISGILFRRSLLRKSGLFHEGLSIAEDCNLWFRMACVGKIVAGDMSRPVSAYFRHRRNTYQPAIDRKKDMIKAMAAAYIWARRQRLPKGMMQIFYRGIREYVLNAIIVTREAGRPDLAWSVVREAFPIAPLCLFSTKPLLRQLGALCRDVKFASRNVHRPRNVAK